MVAELAIVLVLIAVAWRNPGGGSTAHRPQGGYRRAFGAGVSRSTFCVFGQIRRAEMAARRSIVNNGQQGICL